MASNPSATAASPEGLRPASRVHVLGADPPRGPLRTRRQLPRSVLALRPARPTGRRRAARRPNGAAGRAARSAAASRRSRLAAAHRGQPPPRRDRAPARVRGTRTTGGGRAPSTAASQPATSPSWAALVASSDSAIRRGPSKPYRCTAPPTPRASATRSPSGRPTTRSARGRTRTRFDPTARRRESRSGTPLTQAATRPRSDPSPSAHRPLGSRGSPGGRSPVDRRAPRARGHARRASTRAVSHRPVRIRAGTSAMLRNTCARGPPGSCASRTASASAGCPPNASTIASSATSSARPSSSLMSAEVARLTASASSARSRLHIGCGHGRDKPYAVGLVGPGDYGFVAHEHGFGIRDRAEFVQRLCEEQQRFRRNLLDGAALRAAPPADSRGRSGRATRPRARARDRRRPPRRGGRSRHEHVSRRRAPKPSMRSA